MLLYHRPFSLLGVFPPFHYEDGEYSNYKKRMVQIKNVRLIKDL
jgi:hypothetical protein